MAMPSRADQPVRSRSTRSRLSRSFTCHGAPGLVAALAVTLAATLTACGSSASPGSPAAPPASAERCISAFEPSRDYFPHKSTVEHATNFSIRYELSYQVLTVHQPFPGGSAESYVLLRCGAPRPDLPAELSNAPVIETPVRSLFSASTTHLALLDELGAMDVLTGVAAAGYVSTPSALERVSSGQAVEYAPNMQVDVELVVAEQPDVLVTAGSEDSSYDSLREAGIPVLANAEYLEADPLGQAEWIKVFAALTGTEERAEAVFAEIEEGYEKARTAAAGVAERTPVLLGGLSQGVWYMPSGGSYVGRLIADAGGTYPWEGETGTGTRELDFETVFARSGAAAVWIAHTAEFATLADIPASDPRYTSFEAVRQGAVWTNTKATGPGGGSSFYERGVARPDLVLADLVAILHPDLVSGHEFTFYEKLS